MREADGGGEEVIRFQQVFHNVRNGFAGIRFETENRTYHIMLFERGRVQFFEERTGKSCEFPIADLIEFGKSKLEPPDDGPPESD